MQHLIFFVKKCALQRGLCIPAVEKLVIISGHRNKIYVVLRDAFVKRVKFYMRMVLALIQAQNASVKKLIDISTRENSHHRIVQSMHNNFMIKLTIAQQNDFCSFVVKIEIF